MDSLKYCMHGVLGGEEGGCEECIRELAAEHEDACYEDNGEAAYGREDEE